METAVLSIIFNRADTFQKSFNEIRKAKPKKYYIAGDGPRKTVKGEVDRCHEARAIIEQIDWDCEVKTLFQEENLGCRKGVSTALDWFFEDAGEGIVLEDDCVPDQSFFSFCTECLEYYRDDERIFCITGDNHQNGKLRGPYSYYFSQIAHCWGWASWNRAWELWHKTNENFEVIYNQSNQFTPFSDANEMWKYNFKRAHESNGVNTWDYTWQVTNMCNNALTVTPQKNLVENIGFGEDSTHTKNSTIKVPKADMLKGEIKHPPCVVLDKKADRYTYNRHYNLGKFGIFLRKAKSIIRIRTRLRKLFQI